MALGLDKKAMTLLERVMVSWYLILEEK